MRSVSLFSVLLIAAVLCDPGVARAQEPVRQDCLRAIIPTSQLRFDHDGHRRWYNRYWTGRCEGLTGCFSGSPNWNDVVTRVMAQGPPARKAELLPKVCKLGQLIGYEWAKDYNVRCIETAKGPNSIWNLLPMLEEQGDIFDRLERMDSRARAMCKGQLSLRTRS